jgi:hypothetical protein
MRVDTELRVLPNSSGSMAHTLHGQGLRLPNRQHRGHRYTVPSRYPPASKQLSAGRIPESIEKGDLPTVSGCGLTGFS